MVLDVDRVELEKDLAVRDVLLVLVAAVSTRGPQNSLIEATGGGNVPNGDERLRPESRHGGSLGFREGCPLAPTPFVFDATKLHERRRR
jgi:hypothetical protein